MNICKLKSNCTFYEEGECQERLTVDPVKCSIDFA